MAPVKRAASTLKDTAEMVAVGALSQPRVTGSGASRRFGNPWPEWQVLMRVRCTSWRVALKKTALDLLGRKKAYLTFSNGPGHGVAILQLVVLSTILGPRRQTLHVPFQ